MHLQIFFALLIVTKPSQKQWLSYLNKYEFFVAALEPCSNIMNIEVKGLKDFDSFINAWITRHFCLFFINIFILSVDFWKANNVIMKMNKSSTSGQIITQRTKAHFGKLKIFCVCQTFDVKWTILSNTDIAPPCIN